MNKDLFRVGVVGLGKMGLLHSSILNVLPDARLAAICEKNSFTRKIIKKVIPNIPIVEDVSDFSGLNLDAVYVTTPISSHYAVAKAVYQQQIARHLFIEKPLSSNYAQSKELCDLASSVGGVNMVGYLRRFYVTFLKAKKLLDENAVGEPQSFLINAFSSDFYGVHDNPIASIARGGVLRDLGSYAIDMALLFFGDLQVTSSKSESLTGQDAEDAVYFTAQQENGALQGEFSVSWCIDGYRMPEVLSSIKGSKGTIEVNDDQVSLNLNNGSKTTWFRHNLDDNVKFWLGNPEYYREDASFIEAVQTNSIVEPSFKTASKVDSLIEIIQQKAK